MENFDRALTAAINGLSGHAALLDWLLVQVTSVGVPLMIAAVAVQWWRRKDRMQVRHVIVASGLTFLLGLALNQLILLFVHRMRPYDAGVTHLLIAPSGDFSFPSDHATASFGIAFAFLLHYQKRVGAIFALAATVICFSRVFIGTHYFSDILGGVLTAAVAAVVVRSVYFRNTRIDQFITGIL